MVGLIKSNYYKIVSGLKIFIYILILAGIAMIIFNNRNTSLLTGFLYFSAILFPFSTAIGLRKNNTGKWNQYILTLPVRRTEIIKSAFLVQLFVILAGVMMSGIVFSISFALHGFPYYRYIDILLLFSLSIGISFFMSAIFFVCSYIDNKERTEVIGIVSLILGVGLMFGIITAFNIFFEKPNDMQLIIAGLGIQILAFIFYLLSYLLTSSIFSRLEF